MVSPSAGGAISRSRQPKLSVVSNTSTITASSLAPPSAFSISAPSSLYQKGRRPHQTPYLFPPSGSTRRSPSLPTSNGITAAISVPISPQSPQHEKVGIWPRNEWFRKELFSLTDMFNVFLSLAKEGANGTLPIGSNTNNKEQLAFAVYRQYRAKVRLIEPYKRLRNAIKHMQEEYAQSKAQNLLMRYTHMQKMIHEVVQLERQYWQMIDIPVQAISETPQAYVLRVADLLDEQYGHQDPVSTNSPRPGGAIAQLLGTTICIAERTKDTSFFTAMRTKSIEDLREQCAQLSTDLYRLIHKYQALRLAVRELARAYQHTRYYPLVPRYNLLKAMIKRILRTPTLSEQDQMLELE